MWTFLSTYLGVLFLALGFITTYLMFHFWGYPYDEEKRKSSCPQWKMNIHRAFGFAYLIVYIILMVQMVPRMWTYQVEFPTRTVIHMIAALSIGFILLLKISIIRFFRHLEEWMPVLGTALLWFTVLLAGLSLPFVFQEHALAADIEISPEAQERVAAQLGRIEFDPPIDATSLSSPKAIMAGRRVLLDKCVYCHDLKTVISKPRGGGTWWKTVRRMAEKPTFGVPMSLLEQQQVTAYLVAITPDLQDSASKKREMRMAKQASREAMKEQDPEVDDDGGVAEPEVDLEKARETYEEVCSECHELSDVEEAPPTTEAEVRELITRMIEENELEAGEEDLALVRAHLVQVFVKQQKK